MKLVNINSNLKTTKNMKKQTQIPDEKSFYRLPFEKGTFTLTEETLYKHSAHRKPESYFREKKKNISYRNEILTLSVRLENEPQNKQLVFIKVEKDSILVSCNAGTTSSYLSRFAFFTLLDFAKNTWSEYFKKYYWPDFFDPQTGKSKYLKVINDRQGLDVEELKKYPKFYKPGFELPDLQNEPAPIHRAEIVPVSVEDNEENNFAIAYCLAHETGGWNYAEHFPFLVPSHALLTKDKNRIKIFTNFLLCQSDYEKLAPTPKQVQLIELCFKMKELATINRENQWGAKDFTKDDIEKARKLLEVWHEALELLLAQKYVADYRTRGLKSLQQKPKRNSFYRCSFKKERPKLVLFKNEKGDYLTLELRLKIKGKTCKPYHPIFPLFISTNQASRELYLLENFTDFQMIEFFSKTDFKLAVLKCHYGDEIERFVNLLAERYELKES
jgi:hypothetical protein